MARRARLVRQRQIARHAQQRLSLIVERARQKQGFRLLNAEALGKVVQIVIDRQRGRVKRPVPGFCAITSLNLSATVSGVSAVVKWREVHSYQ